MRLHDKIKSCPCCGGKVRSKKVIYRHMWSPSYKPGKPLPRIYRKYRICFTCKITIQIGHWPANNRYTVNKQQHYAQIEREQRAKKKKGARATKKSRQRGRERARRSH